MTLTPRLFAGGLTMIFEAKVTDGVLHITLPRTAKAEKETKKIEVA